MTTGTIILTPGAAILPDGSASNLAPGITRRKGSETAPAKFVLTLDFDATQRESAYWTFRMPTNYASAPTVKLLWMANAASANAVVWDAQIGAVTPADADTPIEHVLAAVTSATTSGNATEARRLIETSITLANLDSLAAGDLVTLCVYRDGANGSDACTVDAELLSIAIDYTTT